MKGHMKAQEKTYTRSNRFTGESFELTKEESNS